MSGGGRPGWLQGYRRTISGERLDYHSPYPGPATSLLVRATDGTMAIEWETGSVPPDFAAPAATFIWMAGIDNNNGSHRFRLAIDGAEVVAFTTSPDRGRKAWIVEGAGGVSLSFETVMVDDFGEFFGFMLLSVPAALLRPGRPLRLKVTGERGESRDWFMVFENELEPGVSVKGEPALVRRDGVLRQLLRVEIRHIAPPAGAVVSAAGGEAARVRLATGYNVIGLTVPASEAARDIEVGVEIEGEAARKIVASVKPVAPREMWLLPHSHLDIGFSDRQPVVEQKQWKNCEEAVRLAGETAAYPRGARFKWNVEQLWAVETYLRQAGDEPKRRFIEAVRGGAIGLQAALAGELTGLCHQEELFHVTDFAREIAAMTGAPVDSVMLTDIPSQTWSFVPAMAMAGVKYVSSGPNYMPFLPDGGDRVGWALKTWADRPFYWISPSGEHRVLFWMAGRGYSWFHGLNMGRIERAPRELIFDYLADLEAGGYPHSMVQVRYTIGGDNGPPDPELADFVKRWNETYESPKIVIATTSEMFAEFERRHGAALPEVRGDFTPYWEDGAASTAAETAENRGAAARLVRAETLWALVSPNDWPAARFADAWRQVVLFDEHTWGASDSVTDPDGENARFQWEYKKAIAAEADRLSRELLEEARVLAAPTGAATGKAGRSAVDIINTCSWARTDVAFLPAGLSAAGDAVTDADGRPVPSQRLSTGELAVLAAGVPALGAKRYFVGPGPASAPGRARPVENGLDNGIVSIAVDPGSGAVSGLRWANGGSVELVDAGRYPGLNHYLYVAGRDPAVAAGPESVVVRPGERGPLVASLIIESGAPGLRGLRREVRLYDGLDRVDFIDRLDKEKVRDKESVHIAFPFRVPDGTVRVDAGWAFVRPEADQIPGACRDFVCVHDSIDISNRDYGVTWIPLDVPLAEIGAITDESPRERGLRVWKKTASPSTLLFSYVMNNYWHTNYKADQEGPVVLRYAVRPHTGPAAPAAKRAGLEAERPLVSVAADEARPVIRFPLEIGPGPIVMTCLKPAADGRGWIMRLFNAGDGPEPLRLSGSPAERGKVYLSDLLEALGPPLPAAFELPSSGIVTLRLER